ncbi:hypothetical protein KCP76_09325 [Salmonella enterica subsp. enterica serovar Weltevreden]|nr:hypothetical protein KCP76_09325 [Salmonella enterica subsp. enterica serovar Weltevreden]
MALISVLFLATAFRRRWPGSASRDLHGDTWDGSMAAPALNVVSPH